MSPVPSERNVMKPAKSMMLLCLGAVFVLSVLVGPSVAQDDPAAPVPAKPVEEKKGAGPEVG